MVNFYANFYHIQIWKDFSYMTGSDFIFLAIFLHGSWSCPLFYRYRFIFFQLRTEICNFRSFVLTQWSDKFYLFIISIVTLLTYHRSIIKLFSSHLPLLDYKFYCSQLHYRDRQFCWIGNGASLQSIKYASFHLFRSNIT